MQTIDSNRIILTKKTALISQKGIQLLGKGTTFFILQLPRNGHFSAFGCCVKKLIGLA
jgi:hypothetical protein